jgi:5-(carboxyamino)imidazole ribonucleotide mutase
MPPGVPVATVAIDGAKNAAVLACQILAVADDKLTAKLEELKQQMSEGLKL